MTSIWRSKIGAGQRLLGFLGGVILPHAVREEHPWEGLSWCSTSSPPTQWNTEHLQPWYQHISPPAVPQPPAQVIAEGSTPGHLSVLGPYVQFTIAFFLFHIWSASETSPKTPCLFFKRIGHHTTGIFLSFIPHSRPKLPLRIWAHGQAAWLLILGTHFFLQDHRRKDKSSHFIFRKPLEKYFRECRIQTFK